MTRSTAVLALALLAALVAAGCGATPTQARQVDPDQPIVMTTETLDWQPGPPDLPPGAEFAVLEGNPVEGAFALRLRLPADYRIPSHAHSLIENVTVISGALHVGNGDKLDTSRGVRVPAGGFVSLAKGGNHYAWTEAPAVVQIHSDRPFDIVYVDPHDDPRRQ
ncbi:MAG: cupin domain-containing protein [Longimicrobiales bacterium]